MTETLLDRLADRAGIGRGFHDVFGTRYETGAETRAALLAAMELGAGTEPEAAERLRQLDEAPWRRVLAPMTVLWADQAPAAVTLHLPRDVARLAWRIRREDGSEETGEADLGRLPVTAEREIEGRGWAARLWPCPVALQEGYHTLEIEAGEVRAAGTVALCPRRCWSVAEAVAETGADGRQARLWGVAAQAYSLRGRRPWGVGTYTDVARLAERVAGLGGGFVGLSPLHLLSPVDPAAISPYSPASRDWLNPALIDPAAVPEIDRRTLSSDPGGDLVDYGAVYSGLYPALDAAWQRFARRPDDDAEKAAFLAFRVARGERLERIATFLALQGRFAAETGAASAWMTWPGAFRDSGSEAVAAFRHQAADRVGFQAFLQWLADRQLAEAARRADALPLGLYLDLAVGAGPGSASVWADPGLYALGAEIGAPPDLLNRVGQRWGLAPISPPALAERGYRPFLEALRAGMRRAGALRIDHVMGLMQLYWVPDGMTGAEGAYVRYPFEALRALLALESRRHRSVVIGEDLGTVPPGFREAMADSGVLSYRVLPFERVGDGLFQAPDAYPEEALVTAGTHDLATVAGFWSGRDIAWRTELGLYPSDEAAAADAAGRAADRRRLVDALIHSGVWPAEPPTDCETTPMTRALATAIHRHLARSPARLMAVQVEDLELTEEQANLPGTVSSHPNWRRRLSRTVDALFDDPAVVDMLKVVAAERPAPWPSDGGEAEGP